MKTEMISRPMTILLGEKLSFQQHLSKEKYSRRFSLMCSHEIIFKTYSDTSSRVVKCKRLYVTQR